MRSPYAIVGRTSIFKNGFIVIIGSTGVGKSDFAFELALRCNGEIINGDLGQFYTPLTIGTAKPVLNGQEVPHHLFNIINQPQQYTVLEYRNDLARVLKQLWKKEKTPIIVGGSTFYMSSIYFPPIEFPTKELSLEIKRRIKCGTWEDLFRIDPVRASELGRKDAYRISRALTIWYSTGRRPSSYKPIFNPLSCSYLIWLSRERGDLYMRINQRVISMMEAGWLDEAQNLLNTPWEPFVRQKGFIGYSEIFDFLRGPQRKSDFDKLVAAVQQKTRHYAKRQTTFWRMLYYRVSKAAKQ